jgi:hypothetical protein
MLFSMSATASKPHMRQLRDLAGIGPSIERNLHALGIQNVGQLAKADPGELYQRLGEIEGKRQDPCVLDTFRCAVAQAANPDLPPHQRDWWWWSRQRKSAPGYNVDLPPSEI